MIKGVIFDMDGVLVNSEPIYRKAWIQTYREIGITIDGVYHDRNISGNHPMVSTARVLADHGYKIEKTLQEKLNLRKEEISYEIILKEGIEPLYDCDKFIDKLHLNNFPLAVASTTAMVVVRKILDTIGIKDMIKVVHSQESVENGKPHPEVYLKTARILECKSQECLVFEDSKSGVAAAKAAGMYCLGVLNGHNDYSTLGLADKVISHFREVTLEDLLDTGSPEGRY